MKAKDKEFLYTLGLSSIAVFGLVFGVYLLLLFFNEKPPHIVRLIVAFIIIVSGLTSLAILLSQKNDS